MFNPEDFRRHFPLICNSKLIYLDSAATAQKPQQVIDAISTFYSSSNANVHRAAHQLSAKATAQFELARTTVAKFIHAHSSKEVIFTKGATEAINLIAQSYGRSTLKPGDQIVVAVSEHHANIVPWQLLAQQTGAEIKVINLTDDAELDIVQAQAIITDQVKIVAVAHASNVTGVINPIEQLIALAKDVGAVTVIDGAQAIAHIEVNVVELDCDFYVFSGHKLYGPTGIGVLYGKQQLLEAMPPWQGGGEMIKRVSFSGTTFNQLPFKFEPGTPNISGVIGLAAAIDFLAQFDRQQLCSYENNLMRQAAAALLTIDGLTIVGNIENKLSIISFVFSDEHPSDIATLLDQQNIAVRAGHHCAMPLMESLQLNGTIRASFAPYNTQNDVDCFIAAVIKSSTFF
ncbi:MAG: SufS family cysteine desulfurase [Gammaproteobacteria bacterium]|nr:SufS family cysteine desulfurase [Gammaproteobacteria bacterium]